MSDMHSQPTVAHWRAFGRAGDLDLDFQARDRAALVTQLLARCRQEALADAEDACWQLSLTARIAGLASIVRLTQLANTQATEALPLQAQCLDCAEAFEMELSLAAICELGHEAERSPVIEIELEDAQAIVLRRPTGADQRRWQAEPEATDASMLADLLVSAPPLESLSEQLTRIAAAMQTADLLSAFQISYVCPHCDHADDLALDLEGALLARLQSHTQQLTLEVHRLASRYGWSEAQILELPPHRRAAYLRLLDQETGWS
jgi:hypothetical protein